MPEVTHRVQCAAKRPKDCTNYFIWKDSVTDVTDEAKELLRLNGWWEVPAKGWEGKWMCPTHEEPK